MLMSELGNGGQLSVAFVNATLLALWPVLPILLFGYTSRSLSVRRVCAEFSLRASETVELERAVRLYQAVCERLKALYDQCEPPAGFWHAILHSGGDADQEHADELDDLEAHAHYLRSAINRLKSQPLRRLRLWVHAESSQFAFAGALAAYIVGFAILIIASHFLWLDDLPGQLRQPAGWYPLDIRLFYANAVAAGCAAVVAPVFYLVRWACLRQQRGLEFCVFKEFAASDFDWAIDPLRAEQPQGQADASEIATDQNWFAVLGLPHSATVAEIKEAYKTLIKQNHPDRVHGMSPAFRKLAEAQTRKLNNAYQNALCAVSPVAADDQRVAV